MKTKHHRPADYIPWDELKNLISELIKSEKKRLALYIAIGSHLGLRHSDIVRLKYSDIKGDELIIDEKKTKKERILTINPELKQIINQCIPEEAIDDRLIFANGNKALTPQGLNQQFKKLREKYKINCEHMSLHSCRKSFGRRYWDVNGKSDVSLLMLSECFNHSSVSITKRYLGIRAEELRNVYLSI